MLSYYSVHSQPAPYNYNKNKYLSCKLASTEDGMYNTVIKPIQVAVASYMV